jgi:hypothetical protein
LVLGINVGWVVEANISEKHAVSIFRAEVMSWDSEELYRITERDV